MMLVPDVVAKRPEIAQAIITHRYPIEDAAEAFRVAAARNADAIKVGIES
jgi:threonine dehydrogenase-like Zn-dependent dehydrogenase